MALKNQRVLAKGDKKAQRPWKELEKELFVKKFKTGFYLEQIEGRMAEARYLHSVKNLHPNDVLVDKDGNTDPFIGDKFFNPHERLPEEAKNDPRLPPEVRKMLNRNKPEYQNLRNPIVDEESAKNYVDSEDYK